MTRAEAFVLREFQCGACDGKFVALAGKVKMLLLGAEPQAVCDYCADEINELRAARGQRPLWEGQ